MSEQNEQEAVKSEMSRRGFLKAGGLAMGTVALGITAGCGDDVTKIVKTADTTPPDVNTDSWLTPPPPITNITKTVTCDVVVVGAGMSSILATRAASDAGAAVVCIEKNATYDCHGFQFGAINSKRQVAAGATIDIEDFLRNYERISIGRVNMELIRLFAENSGAAVDYYTAPVAGTATDKLISLYYWPLNSKHDPSADLFKHYVGAIDFTEGSTGMADTYKANYDLCVKQGVQYYYSTPAQQLVMSGGKVAGVIALNSKGEYIKFLANKGVILCTGNYSGNQNLIEKFCPESVALAKRHGISITYASDGFKPDGTRKTGDGHLMGLWAGAQMQAFPDVCAGSCETVAAAVAVLQVNKFGARVYNEDIEIWQKHDVALNNPGGFLWDIFDVNWQDAIPYQSISHRAFDLTNKKDTDLLAADQKALLALVGNPAGATIARSTCYGANTIEALATMIGIPPATLKATVDRYNMMCAAKKDTDFGKDPQKLFAVQTPPFFAAKAQASIFGLGPVSGFPTNKNLQPLDANNNPIPGLWVAGNVVGNRFAPYYQTPMSGLTNGTALTLGMLAGQNAAKG